MTNPKGTQLETAARNWFREHGWPFAKRVTKEGALDPGDLSLGDGVPVTVECKNEKKINLAGGAKELADEMRNNGHQWGFTIHKKRGTTDVGQYYAVLPVAVLNDILRVKEPILSRTHAQAESRAEDTEGGGGRRLSRSTPPPSRTKRILPRS